MNTSRIPTFTGRVAASSVALTLLLQLTGVSISARDSVSKFERKVVEVVPGKIYRGTQLGDEEDYQYLRKLGIKTHLNLRKYLGWQEQDVHLKAVTEGFFYRHAGLPTLWNQPKDREIEEALGS